MTKQSETAPSESRDRLRICSFESRRQVEMQQLLERAGVDAVVAPSMRDVPLDESPDVARFADEFLAGRIDIVIFLTGVGARTLRDAMQAHGTDDEFLEALRKCDVVVRGPKPTNVLREWTVPIAVRAPEPNTWRELVAAIDASPLKVAGKHVAIQEYGEPSPELYAALRTRGAIVVPVAIYRWALPEETGPLEAAIRDGLEPGFDAILFTSAQQIAHVLQVGERLGCRDKWIDAARTTLIASIGPTCSEALRQAGLEVGLEPSHPHMGHLVKETVAELHRRRSSC